MPDIYPNCFKQYITWRPNNETIIKAGIKTPEACQQLCQGSLGCKVVTHINRYIYMFVCIPILVTLQGITWRWLENPDSSKIPLSCTLYKKLGQEFSCEKCLSAPPKCNCAIPGGTTNWRDLTKYYHKTYRTVLAV